MDFYLHKDTLAPLMAIMDKELLDIPKEELINKQGSGFVAILRRFSAERTDQLYIQR